MYVWCWLCCSIFTLQSTLFTRENFRLAMDHWRFLLYNSESLSTQINNVSCSGRNSNWLLFLDSVFQDILAVVVGADSLPLLIIIHSVTAAPPSLSPCWLWSDQGTSVTLPSCDQSYPGSVRMCGGSIDYWEVRSMSYSWNQLCCLAGWNWRFYIFHFNLEKCWCVGCWWWIDVFSLCQTTH